MHILYIQHIMGACAISYNNQCTYLVTRVCIQCSQRIGIEPYISLLWYFFSTYVCRLQESLVSYYFRFDLLSGSLSACLSVSRPICLFIISYHIVLSFCRCLSICLSIISRECVCRPVCHLVCLYVYPSCLYICLSTCLCQQRVSIYLSVDMFLGLSIPLSVYLSVCWLYLYLSSSLPAFPSYVYVDLSACRCACLSICLSVYSAVCISDYI